MKENYQKLAQEWFERGKDSLLFAKAGFKETCIARDAYYLSHQAAEKYLKGYLVANAVEPERTHDLSQILTECMKIDKQFSELTEQCKFLYEFFSPVRYPGGILENFDNKTGKEAIVSAEEIVDFINKKVKL